jgi:hypothetical protein
MDARQGRRDELMDQAEYDEDGALILRHPNGTKFSEAEMDTAWAEFDRWFYTKLGLNKSPEQQAKIRDMAREAGVEIYEAAWES